MPKRNMADYKKCFEAEFKFSVACGASKEYQKRESEFIKNRLKGLSSGDFWTKEEFREDWLKPIQKIIDELKIGIRVWPIVSTEAREEAKQSGKDLPDAKYNRIECSWCNQMIPRNGAAQFSHLKKHINEVIQDGKITEEEAKEIRSVKLDPKYDVIFKKFFKVETKKKKSVKKKKVVKKNKKKCEWCEEMISSNGAAQFSHLKKHLNELANAGKISKKEVDSIRSIKLTPEVKDIFGAYFKVKREKNA
jgi:hypothetical protein